MTSDFGLGPRVLELREVVKHYSQPAGETVKAVDGVSLRIASGELVALYGPSGSGKSTVLMLIAGLLKPDRGSVHFDRRDISALSARAAAQYRRQDIGFVRQELDVLGGASAIDNAALKLVDRKTTWREARRRVAPLMERLGLTTRCEQKAENLSMGERQRVLIARALSSQPRLLLADEPTGSLDQQRGHAVLTLLTELCREQSMSMLLVTHDPSAAAFANRIYTLRDGALHDGAPDWPHVLGGPR